MSKLPPSLDRSSKPFSLQTPGWWLVISDLHIPYHDCTVIDLALKEATKHKAVGILINGDMLDSHELSTFDKSPEDPRYVDEIQACRQTLRYFRQRLPKARIIFKDGNHEERLYTYLWRRAPALFGLEEMTLPTLLQLDRVDAEHVGERRVIRLGRLNVIHGHEYRPAIMSPVNPARGLFLRAKSVALAGHWHQTSEHHEPTIRQKPQGAWSIGCACGLMPAYMPLNKWNHGFAMVKVGKGGSFEVRNLRVLDGTVV